MFEASKISSNANIKVCYFWPLVWKSFAFSAALLKMLLKFFWVLFQVIKWQQVRAMATQLRDTT